MVEISALICFPSEYVLKMTLSYYQAKFQVKIGDPDRFRVVSVC